MVGPAFNAPGHKKDVERRVSIAIDELSTGWAPVKPSDRLIGRLAFVLDGMHATSARLVRFAGQVLIDHGGVVHLGARLEDVLYGRAHLSVSMRSYRGGPVRDFWPGCVFGSSHLGKELVQALPLLEEDVEALSCPIEGQSRSPNREVPSEVGISVALALEGVR